MMKVYLENTARFLTVALAFVIPLSNTATTVVAAGVLLCSVVTLDFSKIKSLLANPVVKAVLIILALYLLGSIFSIGSTEDIQRALRKASRLLFIPLLIPLFTLPDWRRYVQWSYIAAVTVSVIISLVVGQSIFKDSIFTSLFVAYAIYMLANFAVSNTRYRWLSIILIILLTYFLMFVSIGRTGQILFFGLYLLFCWQTFGWKIKYQAAALAILSMVVAVSLVLPSSFIARQTVAAHEIQNYISDQEQDIASSSTGLRLTFARNAIELIKLKPVFGWGTGGFRQAYAQVFPESKDSHTYAVNPHNQYLLTGVELGLIGMVSLVYLFFTLIIGFWRDTSLDSRLGLGAVLAIAVGCLANSWLLDFASMYFFVVMVGVSCATKHDCLRDQPR